MLSRASLGSALPCLGAGPTQDHELWLPTAAALQNTSTQLVDPADVRMQTHNPHLHHRLTKLLQAWLNFCCASCGLCCKFGSGNGSRLAKEAQNYARAISVAQKQWPCPDITALTIVRRDDFTMLPEKMQCKIQTICSDRCWARRVPIDSRKSNAWTNPKTDP